MLSLLVVALFALTATFGSMYATEEVEVAAAQEQSSELTSVAAEEDVFDADAPSFEENENAPLAINATGEEDDDDDLFD